MVVSNKQYHNILMYLKKEISPIEGKKHSCFHYINGHRHSRFPPNPSSKAKSILSEYYPGRALLDKRGGEGENASLLLISSPQDISHLAEDGQ